MKAFFRWLAKVFGSAVTIALVIVLFPYLTRIAARLMPDESGAAIKASAVLAAKLENSARLETFKVEESGVLNYEIQAALLGSVASVNVKYLYEASFGLDLSKVKLQAAGNELVFTLPALELLQDSLTPSEVYRDDFWYPGFSDADYEKLLEDERVTRRNHYLTGEQLEQLRSASIKSFEKTIKPWLLEIDASLSIQYLWEDMTR